MVGSLAPQSVANIDAGPLGEDPRVEVKVIDAAAIDTPEHPFDLVVFAQSFQHLEPSRAASSG